MRKLILLSMLGSLLVFACSNGVYATTAIIPRDDEMVVESRAIITGRVTGISVAEDANTQLVYTYIRLNVSSVLKGQIADREIILKKHGGEPRDHGTWICGTPKFELGQDVLLFLNSWPDGALRIHQGFLGKFDINRDPSSGRLFVERRMVDQNVTIMAANGTNRSELDAYTALINDLMKAN